MDYYIDSLANATIFLTCDANNGYWKVEVAEAKCDKACFTSHHGVFPFTCTPLILKASPGTIKQEWQSYSQIQMALGHCIFRQYRHILKYARQTFQPCLTSVDVITWHGWEFRPTEMRSSYEPYWLSWSCHSPWAHRSFAMTDWHYLWTWKPGIINGAPVISGCM